MAGDWIKVDVGLPDKPEVFNIADELGITREEVVGRLLRVWIWCGSQTHNGAVFVRSLCAIDAVAGTQGFAQAMQSTKWLEPVAGGFRIPNWDRHMSKSAKARALNMERMRKNRAVNVRMQTAQNSHQRREEKSLSTKVDRGGTPAAARTQSRMKRPSAAEAELYASKIGLPMSEIPKFLNHYEANGWRVGKNPMRSWQAAMRKWKSNWEQWREQKRQERGLPSGSFEDSIHAKLLRDA